MKIQMPIPSSSEITALVIFKVVSSLLLFIVGSLFFFSLLLSDDGHLIWLMIGPLPLGMMAWALLLWFDVFCADGSDAHDRVERAWTWAWRGAVCGFLPPLATPLFLKDAGLFPMVGFFFSGPLGFIFGALTGTLRPLNSQ